MRPAATFVLGAILGALVSLTISLNLILFIVAATLTVIVPLWMRSAIALSGASCGFGLTWLIVIGTSYARCVSIEPNCVFGDGRLPPLVVAAVVLTIGFAVGVVRWASTRAPGSPRTP